MANTHYFYLLCFCKSDSSLYIDFGIFIAEITSSIDYHTDHNLFPLRCSQDIGYGLRLHDDY